MYRFECSLIESILDNWDIDPIKVHQQPGYHDIVNGRQRLTCILRFFKNEFSIPWNGKQVYYNDLLPEEQRKFMSRGLSVTVLSGYTDEDVMHEFVITNNTLQMSETDRLRAQRIKVAEIIESKETQELFNALSQLSYERSGLRERPQFLDHMIQLCCIMLKLPETFGPIAKCVERIFELSEQVQEMKSEFNRIVSTITQIFLKLKWWKGFAKGDFVTLAYFILHNPQYKTDDITERFQTNIIKVIRGAQKVPPDSILGRYKAISMRGRFTEEQLNARMKILSDMWNENDDTSSSSDSSAEEEEEDEFQTERDTLQVKNVKKNRERHQPYTITPPIRKRGKPARTKN